MTSRFSDITDGSSNTVAMGEIGTVQNRQLIGQFATDQTSSFLSRPSLCLSVRDLSQLRLYRLDVSLGQPGRGGRLADGAAGYSLFNTVLPPNSPSCGVGGAEAVDGLYAAGSFHPGGATVVMVDGSVRFISDNIDTGDLDHPPATPQQLAAGPVASPYGVWGAIGTATGEEKKSSSW